VEEEGKQEGPKKATNPVKKAAWGKQNREFAYMEKSVKQGEKGIRATENPRKENVKGQYGEPENTQRREKTRKVPGTKK